MNINTFSTYCASKGLSGVIKETPSSFLCYLREFNGSVFHSFSSFTHIAGADRSPYKYVVKLTKSDAKEVLSS